MRRLPSAAETASLIALNIQRYSKERGKTLGRFRMSRASLRNIAIRTRLEDTWINQLIEAMSAEYNWIVFNDEDDFIFLKRDAALSWTKISSKRVSDLTKRLRSGDDGALIDAYAEIHFAQNDEEDEEGD